MDAYGLPAPEFFRIDDLLDFTNEDLIASTNTVDADSTTISNPPPRNLAGYNRSYFTAGNISAPVSSQSTDFTDALSIPNEDVAELEWLSKFVDDSFSDYPETELTCNGNIQSDTSFTGKGRSKRSRATPKKLWTSSSESEPTMIRKCETTTIRRNEMNGDWSSGTEEVRRCTHCSSEKTPQWRTGPLGPKTLCNACGVRFKSGRLVPEYRPAASPTFVLTQHSNSHRKVMELRRQKETNHQNQQQDEHNKQRQFYHHQVC